MRLGAIELYGIGSLSGVRIAFGEEPRALTVLFGGDGVGKTTVLSAIATTRPGHALPIMPRRPRVDRPGRSPSAIDDASRADLTRETKQVLSYAGIASALDRARSSELDATLRDVCQIVLAPFQAQYEGVHPKTLEPVFSHEGRDAIFEELPRGARHLVAIVTGATRALHGAFMSHENAKPLREREGVVVIDDLEAQQDAALLRHVPALLKASLPRVQWIVATSAAPVTLGCERDEVIALRREPDHGRVVVHEGAFAVLH